MSEKGIFLCEDDPDSYDGLARLLNMCGYKVELGAKSVGGALSIVHQLVEAPVLAALIDKEFPDGSGDQIAKAINDLKLRIHTIGIGSLHNVNGVEINILKPQGPGPLLDYLATLR